MNAISAYGKNLYALLPEIYRQRDAHEPAGDPNHLLRYLDSHGVLLDLVRGTLEQMYADHFPDIPDSGLSCQAWIVPYLADLVGTTPVSPFADGQRDEVANAIRWSKRKGTLVAVQEIVEQVALSEAEIQEGWQRVVVAARPDDTILPATFFGESYATVPSAIPRTTDPPPTAPNPIDVLLANPTQSFAGVNPQIAARHPGLRAATVDMRTPSRAIQADPGAMGAHATRFNTALSNWPRDDNAPASPSPAPTGWRQYQPHGAPCFPDSYEDVSQRTADMRTADPAGAHGRYHPKALIIYMPPPFGLCPPVPAQITWPVTAADWTNSQYLERVDPGPGNPNILIVRNKTGGPVVIQGDLTIGPAGTIALPAGITLQLEGLRFDGTLTLAAGNVVIERGFVSKFAFASDANARSLIASNAMFSQLTGGSASDYIDLEYCTILDTISTVAKPETTGVTYSNGAPADTVIVPWPANPGDWINHPYLERIDPSAANPGELVIRNKTSASVLIQGNFTIGPAGTIALAAGVTLRLEKLRFDGTLTLDAGSVVLERCAVRELALATDASSRTLSANGVLFSKLTGGFSGDVKLMGNSSDLTLIKGNADNVELEYCTILDQVATAADLKASEVIFPDGTPADSIACARYSRLPSNILDPNVVRLSPATNTGAEPLFISNVFGQPGAGVLRPDASTALLNGAEDGTEMGAYHDWRYAALRSAILRKLTDYLPLGVQPVIVWDSRLLVTPPELTP